MTARRAFSPDGHVLAASGTEGVLWFWDMADPDRPRFLTYVRSVVNLNDTINAVAFSPDGHTLAVGTDGPQTLWLWDVADPSHPRRLAVPHTDTSGQVHAVAFSPDGRTLAAGSADQTVRRWDTSRPDQPRARPLPWSARRPQCVPSRSPSTVGSSPPAPTATTSGSGGREDLAAVRTWRPRTADAVSLPLLPGDDDADVEALDAGVGRG